MKNKIKKNNISKNFLVIFSISLLFFSFSNFVFAENNQEETIRPLELEYPQFGPEEFSVPITVETPFSEYVRYIFYFIIGISGIIAFAALVYAGFLYLASADNPAVLQSAKDQILAAFIGIIILLMSWIVLNTINPQLLILKEGVVIPGIPEISAGIWLCKSEQKSNFDDMNTTISNFRSVRRSLGEATNEEEKEEIVSQLENISKQGKEILRKIYQECYLVESSGSIRRDFQGEAKQAYSIPFITPAGMENKYYGAILFEEPNYEGNIQFFSGVVDYTMFSWLLEQTININPPYSIMTFIINENPDPNWKVTVYEEVDFNRGFKEEEKASLVVTDECLQPSPSYTCSTNISFNPKSIEFTRGSDWIAILSKGGDPEGWREQSDVFVSSDSNLLDNYRITEEDCDPIWWFRCITMPIAESIYMYSATIY